MAKWQRRLDQLIKDEKEKHEAVYDLFEKVKSGVHAETKIDIDYIREKVNRLCEETKLVESHISNVRVEYAYDENKPQNLLIRINIEGNFKGMFTIETQAGTRGALGGNDREDIYYAAYYDCKVSSNKEEQVKRAYESLKEQNVDLLIDLAFDKKWYVKYSGRFKSYTIWDHRPKEYGDIIEGYMDTSYDKKPKRLFEINKSLKYLLSVEKASEAAKKELIGEEESVTYEWYKYSL